MHKRTPCNPRQRLGAGAGNEDLEHQLEWAEWAYLNKAVESMIRY